MLINNYIIFIYKLIFKTNKTIKNFFSLLLYFIPVFKRINIFTFNGYFIIFENISSGLFEII